ncbi:WD repeat-containing protein 44 isoform X2 [Microtus ochrogaster]|uniref:WD repeat-containing protein 44 n=1 Tax=Microtus ochrogaster TaxID=79684 RepID=A0ABM1AWY5_MICOH|nr:WD repeat-containing protein 44 isoform X2 [Microtus ochrogaster]XP_013209841.1 WD repeat-containing protein 44 isoform X2 [Microtus ochrogaster]XP_026645945.1 WD repeat-containing protein 44 isoform X2 [Microtus ochrogaster]
MASESDTEEFYDAPEDVHLGGGYPVGSPEKIGLSSVKIIESIIEESQKVLQSEDDSLDSKGRGLSDQATASSSVAETDFSDIPGLLSIEHELQHDSEKADSPTVFEEAELEAQRCFPSEDSSEKTVDETANVAEGSSAEQLDVSELETEILSKEAMEVKESHILDPASSDSLSAKDFAAAEEVAPAKPPRHLTPEPDIVASTKKPVPARPPPPTNFPPSRPPPPTRPAPPPRKKKSELELEALKTPDLDVPKDNITSDSLLTANVASESTVRDSQPSLDLASATSGDKIVTAQENGKAPDLQTVAGEVMGPQRPRSNSGRELTDEEILASVMIKNLDTGEEIPLSLAEEKLPTGINPLTLHIMRRTKEYVSNDATQSDDEEKLQSQQTDTDGGRLKQKTTQLKKFLGKSVKRAKHLAEEYGERAINKVKSVRDEVFHTDQDDPSSSDDEGMPYTRPVKFKAAHGFKGPYDFDQIKVVQDLSGEHMGAVWTMKFSHCGRLLASAGQDNIVRIWALKNAFDYFNNMRMKYNTEGRVSPSPSQESLSSSKSDTDTGVCSGTDEDTDDKNAPFRQRPFCKYKGHTADLLDLSWSKNYFLLSSSMDKTVRLWHISRRECLCCFQHIDFVTAIAFHPRDDRYFLSGSLDGKLRLWNIPDKKVALWNEVDGQTKLITAANFCQNGKYAVIGTYDGRCIFYDTEHLKYHTQIHVRSTRGRNKVGRKITGIEPLPGENKILVTSNDSRIRLYDLRDLSLSMKYKGYVNSSSQIKASFSHDFTYLVSGSEDKYVYIWSTYHDLSKFTSVRRDRNDFWEGIKAHNAVVTSAIFAPNPSLMLSLDIQTEKLEGTSEDAEVLDSTSTGIVKTDNTEVLLSADFTGAIKVFINRRKTVF